MNAAIFERLTTFAADRGVAIPTKDRRVFLDEEEFDLLAGSTTLETLNLGRRQGAALITSEGKEFLALAGFESDKVGTGSRIRESAPSPGLTIAALASLAVAPTANPAEIFDVVGADTIDGDPYTGHDFDLVRGLFPRLRLMEIDPAVSGRQNFAANLLVVCAEDCVDGNGWIAEELASEIAKLGEQQIAAFPYEFLIRAVVDLDPTNLYLALYRCLEATYAYDRANKLAEQLNIKDKTWIEVAKVVGDSLSWYPRHDQALSAILRLPGVDVLDLKEVADCLGKDSESEDLAAHVAGGVRDLRNSLVHYGPTTKPVANFNNDWNHLCAPLARIVGAVFEHAYSVLASESVATQDDVDVPDVTSNHLPNSRSSTIPSGEPIRMVAKFADSGRRLLARARASRLISRHRR